MVQYRNEILPLIPLSGFQPSVSSDEADQGKSVKAVVYSDHGRSVGIVVDQIIDIVKETISIERRSQTSGVIGSAIIQGNVTDLIDVEGVIRGADPTFFEQAAPA